MTQPLITRVPTLSDTQLVTRGPAVIEGTEFVLADLGSGTQITHLKSNQRDWYFDNAPLWKIYLWDGVSNPLSNPILPTHFTTQTVVQTPTTFTITWTHAVYGTVVVNGAYQGTELRLTCTVTIGSSIASFYSVWGIDLPNLKVKPLNPNDTAAMRAIWPAASGLWIRGTPTPRTGDLISVHPGTGATSPLGAPGGPACIQAAALYSAGVRSALLMRADDTVGRAKGFGINGDGTNTILFVRQFAPDPLTFGNNFTSSYGVMLETLAKSPHQVMEHIRTKLATTRAVERGKIRNDTANNISTLIKNCSLIHQINAPTPYDSAGWTRAANEVLRVQSYLGVTPTVLLYTWRTQLFADDWPDWSPIPALVDTFLSTLNSNGIKVIIYTEPTLWGLQSTWLSAAGTPPANYSAATGGPLDDVVLTYGQAPFQTTKAGLTAGLGDNVHYVTQVGDASARTHIVNQWVPITNSGTRNIHGLYLDAFCNIHYEDFRASLPADSRGAGGSSWIPGSRSLMTQLRTSLRATYSDFAIISENPSDFFTDVCELFATVSFLPLDPASSWNHLFKVALGEYVPTFGFDVYGIGGPGTEALFPALFWNQSLHFHSGKIQHILWGGETAFSYFVSQSGDTHHTWWTTYAQTYVNWVKTLAQAMDIGVAVRKYIMRGRRLAPLPGSQDENLENANPTLSELVMASAWFSDETDAIAILVTNHHSASTTFRIQMAPEDFPELTGRGILAENVAGVRSTIQTLAGSIDYTVTVPAYSLKVFEVYATAPAPAALTLLPMLVGVT